MGHEEGGLSKALGYRSGTVTEAGRVAVRTALPRTGLPALP